jgi:hypothetical protein
MGTIGHLPEQGGILDQHAPTMQGLAVLTECVAWLDEAYPRPPAKRRGQ